MEHWRTEPKPFSEALKELLRESDFTTSSGRPNLAAFADALDGIGYETVRKVVAGQRRPTMHLIEACARALGVRSDYFAEYRLLVLQQHLDPRRVGFPNAIRTLESITPGGHAVEEREEEIPPAPEEAIRDFQQLLAEVDDHSFPAS